MRTRNRKGFPGRTFLAAASAAITLLAAGPAFSDVDFLVPGVSLHSVDFTAGTSVSYLIITEAHGIKDSSLVTLEVTGEEAGSA